MPEKYRILIGYDGSDCANAAVEDLPRAGLPGESEAIVLSVCDAWAKTESFDDLPSDAVKPSRENLDAVHRHVARALEKAQNLADEGAARLQAVLPAWSVGAEARSGKPAWEIVEKSDEWRSNLIVVGSQGRTALGRLLLGSVSQKVLTEARCAVRIARRPRSKAENAPVRVLIAADGSHYAEKAVQAVAARRWPPDAEFRIITADDDPFSRPEVSLIDYLPEGRKDSPAAQEWIERVVETPARILNSAGLGAEQSIRWGEARQIILDEAESWRADCIFLGARGLGRFRRFLLGSVASAVAAKAKCSVEIIR